MIEFPLTVALFHYQIAGELRVDFAIAAAATITVQCTIILEADISGWDIDDLGNPISPPRNITDLLCPNACSDNGECDLGTTKYKIAAKY